MGARPAHHTHAGQGDSGLTEPQVLDASRHGQRGDGCRQYGAGSTFIVSNAVLLAQGSHSKFAAQIRVQLKKLSSMTLWTIVVVIVVVVVVGCRPSPAHRQHSWLTRLCHDKSHSCGCFNYIIINVSIFGLVNSTGAMLLWCGKMSVAIWRSMTCSITSEPRCMAWWIKCSPSGLHRHKSLSWWLFDRLTSDTRKCFGQRHWSDGKVLDFCKREEEMFATFVKDNAFTF